MDDSKKRTITEETLKITVEKMNPVLIKSLPASPEEILPYAQRRENETIKIVRRRLSCNIVFIYV